MANQVIIDGEVCFGSTNKASSIIYEDKQGNKYSLQTVLDNLINYIYPVGSIYISTNEVSPAVLFGGTWEKIENRFLLAAGSDYTTGSTGGEAKHTHNYGIQYGGYYRSSSFEKNTNAGCLNYDVNNNFTISTEITGETLNAPINGNVASSTSEKSMAHYYHVANTSYTPNMPPYLVVNIWKRTE